MGADDVRIISAAEARALRAGAAPHLDDELETTLHLAISSRGATTVISAFARDEQGRPSDDEYCVYGPFGGDPDSVAAIFELSMRLGGPNKRFWSAPKPDRLAADSIRRRPDMYVGTRETRGILKVVEELICNAVDEHLDGHATRLSVVVDKSTVLVSDDGRGIPIASLERWCLYLHSKGDVHGQRRHAHINRFGLGLAVVCSLSSLLTFTVDSGRRHHQVFGAGVALTPPMDVGAASGHGTAVAFTPDMGIFTEVLKAEDLLGPLGDLAVLNPELRVELQGQVVPSFGGLLGYARHLAGIEQGGHHGVSEHHGIRIEIAVCATSRTPADLGWVNFGRAIGSHVDGAQRGLIWMGEAPRILLVSVFLDSPAFAGRTRDKLVEAQVARLACELGARMERG